MELPRTVLHALHDQASRHAERPALWSKRSGRYLPTSWREYASRVKHLALGLNALGLGQGDALAIIGFNREEWVVSDLAAMALGAVPAGVYTSSSPEQTGYVAGHCEAKVAVVENAGYLEKLLSVRERLPKLRWILVMDPPAGALPEGVLRYSEVLERGRGLDEAPYWRAVNALEPGGLATLIYTSGTTGNPKGVMLSHRNLTWTADRLSKVAALGDEIVLSYLPLSHIAEQLGTIHCGLLNGFQVYFAESLDALPEDLREVRPTLFFGVPRVWEKFRARAEEGLSKLSPPRRRLMDWARGVARERHAISLAHQRVPLRLELQYQLARRTVFEQLKQRIGFDRTRFFLTAAAPIGKDVLEFFASVDMILYEIYGQSEVTGPTTANTPGETRLGTRGRPLLGVEVRIAEDGEILVRGENVCLGYFKEPESSAQLLAGGWLHSGDVGELDPEGFLRITGRKKEIIITSGGKKTAPANIEALLRAIPPVSQAVVIGEGRNYLVALLTVEPEQLQVLSRNRGWPQSPDAASPKALRSYLEARIQSDVNARLSRFEQIKRFCVLPRDFTVDSGELTPTLKVRRMAVEEKYRAQIEALYGEPGAGRAAG